MPQVKASGLRQAECRLSLVAQAIAFCRLRRAPGYSPSVRTHTTSARGQALIEFALVLPLLLLLIFNLVNFGAFLYAMITVANAARTGAQYMIMGGAWVGGKVPADYAAINTLVSSDTNALPNKASLRVRVCTLNGTDPAKVLCTGTVPSPAPPWTTQVVLDPEPGLYVVAWVDVAYTYQPLIPDFPVFGIHLTIPTTSIHRRATMRMVQ